MSSNQAEQDAAWLHDIDGVLDEAWTALDSLATDDDTSTEATMKKVAAARKPTRAIAARIREGYGEKKPTTGITLKQPPAEYDNFLRWMKENKDEIMKGPLYLLTGLQVELGPQTLAELRLGFAIVAAACNEAHEESYVPTCLMENARHLAAAMAVVTHETPPGEQQAESCVMGEGQAPVSPHDAAYFGKEHAAQMAPLWQRIQELEAERDRAVDKMTECGMLEGGWP